MEVSQHNHGRRRILTMLMAVVMICTMMYGIVIPASAADYDLVNPISGTVQGAGYDESAGHYGIDLYPYNYGDPVYAVSSGTLMYSCERNHTREYQAGDDCCTVKIILDEPITYNGMTYVCAFYTHMSSLVYDVYCGYKDACVAEYDAGLRENALPTESVHVEAGDLIGYVGKGNGATHLHFSFEASESDGYEMMPNSEYYDVFGWEYNCNINACEYVNVDNMVATTFASKTTLAQLQSKFPAGAYWNGGNADKYTWTPCSHHNPPYCSNTGTSCGCNWFLGALQCHGYVKKITYDYYGSHMMEWSKVYNLNSLKPGDAIRYKNDGHTIWVTAVNGDTVTFTDCNWNGSCNIRWDISTSKSTIAKTLTCVYVAPSAITGSTSTHTHTFSITESEAAHPHKEYKRCSCGEFGGYTGNNIYVSSCSSCNEVCSCSTGYAGTYTCVTTTYPLTIRTAHNTNSSAKGSIPPGASVTVTKANGNWAHVQYGGVSGYASMEYLVRNDPSIDTYPLPFKAYTLSDANHAADAFDAPNGNHIGYIYGTDYCTVKEIYSNGFCLVNCPWDGGYKDVYTWTGCFLNTSSAVRKVVVEEQAATYIRLRSSTELGWIDAGDQVTVVDDTYSDQKQVIYPHTDGTYRCAWVNAEALVHKHSPGPAATCTTPQICTTCDAIIAGVTNHTPGAAATCTSNQICTVCKAILAQQKSHTPGAAATCTTPQTCSVCGTVLNNAKGHSYTAGDYTEPTHPHTIYNTCACGAMWDSGTTTTIFSCEICNPPATYEVSFITNGGTPTILPYYMKQGETITLLSLTKEGHTFLGWDTDSSADNAVYKAGEVYTVNGDAKLYAVWKQDTVAVTGISLNKSSVAIDVGESLTLSATVTPSNATNQSVKWTSSDASVATVTNGVVTGKKSGTATIKVTTVEGSFTTSCIVEVNDASTENAEVIFTISDVTGRPGDTIEVDISIDSEVAINSIGLFELVYDSNVLTFAGFTNTEDILSKCYFDNGFDENEEVITLALRSKEALSGDICTMMFTISEVAEDGTTTLMMDSLVKCDSTVITSAVEAGAVNIQSYLLGDINGDNFVDINDAAKLFQYSMLPEIYPITYVGDVDFNNDGVVDINDAARLFQYSMLPDIYPIS